MSVNLDELYPRYQAEMAYLRRMGGVFAQRYPKVAARLELSVEESPDPQIERLLESFAFLTARLQHRLDTQFPEITTSLLGALHPHLVDPVAPMAIAQFEADPAQGKPATAHTLARHTRLFAQTAEGLTCRFRTCYPVVLWPVSVEDARLESKTAHDFLEHRSDVAAVLRLRLRAHGAPFRELSVRELRFHLHGEPARMEALYELILSSTIGMAARAHAAQTPRPLLAEALRPAGFGAEEDVLPYPSNAHPASRLLQEYFHFPEKYLFFDVGELPSSECDEHMELLFLLSRIPAAQVWTEPGDFRLGCTPIVNLFPRTTEPIRVEQRQTEYRLVPDMRRERTTEVHSITAVSGSSQPGERQQDLQPFFSFRPGPGGEMPRAFWHARRVASERVDIPGTEIRLSFVDLDFKPAEPPRQMVYAHTLCTNRDLADQVPAGARLQIEEKAPVFQIRCLGKPTTAMYPRLGGAALWSLVGSLSLNHMSLSGPDGLAALQTMLRLFGGADSPRGRQQLEAIRGMECREVVRRLGREAWRGFCAGHEIALELDDHAFQTHGAYLFGNVLQHFFGLYTAINSFTQLTLRSNAPGGAEYRFAARSGTLPLI